MTTFLFANVVVSGISIIGKTKITHRSRFILAMALGVGIGVACEPHFAEGGGVAAFYGGNLKHNYGFWPKSKVCKVFPTVTTTTYSCTIGGYEADFTSYGTEEEATAACDGLNGGPGGFASEDTSAEVLT